MKGTNVSGTLLIDPKESALSERFDVPDEYLAEMREKATGLTCDTPEGYENTRLAIADCRTLRVRVEKTRKELNEDALKWQRAVNAEAKRITAAIESIENPLQANKDAVDQEKERIRAEKAAAIQRKLEEEAAARRAAEEARLKAEREAEEARIAEERRVLEAEQAKLRAEREAMEAERKRIADEQAAKEAAARAEQEARDRAEREKIEAERRAVEEQRRKLQEEEFQRQAKIKAEQDARDKLERERIEAERQAIETQKRQAELAALKPDIEKVAAFADMLRAIEAPKVKSTKVRGRLNDALSGIKDIADSLAKAEF